MGSPTEDPITEESRGSQAPPFMLSLLRRRIQPLHLRTHFRYQYNKAGDPSRVILEELVDGLALKMIRRAFLGVLGLPVIPELFSAERPPTPMSSELKCEYSCTRFSFFSFF